MATLMNIEATKTYKTRENAIKAAEAKFGNDDLRYFIMTAEDGRFFPVFVGEKAVQAGVHFHFNIIG